MLTELAAHEAVLVGTEAAQNNQKAVPGSGVPSALLNKSLAAAGLVRPDPDCEEHRSRRGA
jgi:hypothetical protein